MLSLRPYKSCDAKKIAGWISDETVYYRWGGDHFGPFPLTEAMINEVYANKNGNCKEEDNFYPWVVYDDDNVVGSFIMRYIHGDKKILRFGWVVVDTSVRGKGYGSSMLKLGLRYAFELLNVEKVTIGVFKNNTPAYKCYTSLGFSEVNLDEPEIKIVNEEPWELLELEITKDDYNSGK